MVTPYMDGCGHWWIFLPVLWRKMHRYGKKSAFALFTFESNKVKSNGSMLASNRAWRLFRWDSKCPIDAKTAKCDLLGTIVRVFGGGPGVLPDIETDHCDNNTSTKKIESEWGSTRIVGTGRMVGYWYRQLTRRVQTYKTGHLLACYKVYIVRRKEISKAACRCWKMSSLRIHLHFTPCGDG